MKKIILFFLLFLGIIRADIIMGAEQMNRYLPMLKGKKVAVVVNQSSLVYGEHLVDVLLRKKVKIVKIFAPEHGFRGNGDAGEHLKNKKDRATGLPIISLYGKHKKPTKSDLYNVDIIIFDIQDVGVRFYTYLSTLHYVMEAAAQNHTPIIVLDRPNPNISRIDGEILNFNYKSFVGMHPVPILYGMTIGEYALMINGEGWLKGNLKANLRVIPLEHYTHHTFYYLPVKPSPNLPNELAIYLYPSLALFEGTVFSVGRGTDKQFQIYGNPYYKNRAFSFTPYPMEGAKHPKYEGIKCYGVDLRSEYINLDSGINLNYIIDAYNNYHNKNKKNFFLKNRFFDKLAGSNKLRRQIEAGMSPKEIKQSWEKELNEFKQIRKNYLIYQ
jgi:uncharacterized protein YbbC (DUF1343 family)